MSKNGTEPRIRIIAPEDAEGVAELCAQLGYPRTGAEVREWVSGVRDRTERQTAFVAVADGGKIVGWITVSLVSDLQTPEYGLIGGLVVADGVRGLGVGRRLCQAAETWSWERGVGLLRVISRATREAAHRFYLRDGYKEIKTSVVFGKARPNG